MTLKDKKINGETCFYDGILTILKSEGEKIEALQIILQSEDVPITLDKCLELIGATPEIKGTVTVICEDPMCGEIYKYGNHGCFWEMVGETVGYF